jgi:hypothetical protein
MYGNVRSEASGTGELIGSYKIRPSSAATLNLLNAVALRLEPIAAQQRANEQYEQVTVTGVYECTAYSGIVDDLPDEPFVAPAGLSPRGVSYTFLGSLLGKLKKYERHQADETHFEELPDERDVVIFDDVLQGKLERGVTKAFRNSGRSHCSTACFEKKIKREFDFRSEYWWQLDRWRAYKRRQRGKIILQSGTPHKVRREERDKQQRVAAKKQAERDRKSVPKAERIEQRKKGRELREQQHDIEFQGFKDIALTAALSALGVVGLRCINKVSGVADSFAPLLKTIDDVSQQLKKSLSYLWFIPLVLVLRYFMGSWNNAFATGAIVAFLPKLLGSALWSRLSAFFPTGKIETQVGFVPYGNLLATAFTFSVFRGRMSPAKISEFCKRIGSIDRMASGWKTFITWTMSSLEALVNFVRDRFGKDHVQLFVRADRIALDWAREAEKFIKEDTTGKELTPAELDKAIDVFNRGFGLKELYRGSDTGRLVDSLLAAIGSRLAPYLGSITARNNFRFEPVTAFLYGQPGVGKTVLAVPFVTALLLGSGLVKTPTTPEIVASEMWQKGTTEYWQGYNKQKALIMDDAFQNRANATDKDNDYYNMIKMVGSFSMPLNFADIPSKGKIFFGSQLVFGSTNLSSFAAEASVVIQEPAAVARRILFGYELTVNDEYQLNGKLDYSKFRDEWDKCIRDRQPGGDPMGCYPWYIWSVAKHDFLTGSTSSMRIPLEAAMREICDTIRMRVETHEVVKQNIGAMVSAFNGIEVQSGVSELSTISEGDTISSDSSFEREPELFTMPKFRCSLRHKIEEAIHDHNCVKRLLSIGIFAVGAFFAFKVVAAILTALCTLLAGLRGKQDVKLHSNRPATQPHRPKTFVALQSGTPDAADKAFANTYKIYNKTSGLILGQILFVCHELAMMPQHYLEVMRNSIVDGTMSANDDLILRRCASAEVNIRLTVGALLTYAHWEDRENDVAFVKFQSIRAHASLLTAFVKESELRFVGGLTVQLNVCEIDRKGVIVDYNVRTNRIMDHVFMSKSSEPLYIGDGRIMKRYLRYNADTVPGECGAVLTLDNAKLFGGRCILGVHCAGDRPHRKGYSNIVTLQMVEKAMEHLGVINDKSLADLTTRGVQYQCGSTAPFDNMGSFQAIAVLDKPTFMCPVTSYYRTQIGHDKPFGVYDGLPAVLRSVERDGVRVWPMENAVKPYSSPLIICDYPHLHEAAHCAILPFAQETYNVSRQLYSFEEAIIGIPQEKFRSIPRNTAAGFPYVYYVTGGKREFFGDSAEYDLTGPQAVELRTRVTYIIEEAKKGVRLSHIFVDFLKDELRPKAKIDSVSTRLISSAPLDYVVAWRMYFGAFSSAIMRKNVTSGMAPGICTYSDWPRVAQHLTSKGSRVFDGDFKSFDSSEQPCVHDAILGVINQWYDDGPENMLVRKVLWLDLVHSRHVGGRGDSQRYIYQWNKSLPSGHPFTTIVNSMYSLVMLICCYFQLTGDIRAQSFWKHVAPLTYGDDNVVNVDDEVSHVFNQVTVSTVMYDVFSLVYTGGNKTNELCEFTELSKATFLKRRFFLDNCRWLCPLELDSFLYTSYWCKNKKLERETTVSVLENALEELSLHSQAYWDLYASDIATVLRDSFGLSTARPLTRKSYLALVLSRTEDWY